jgi:hypothetical protein
MEGTPDVLGLVECRPVGRPVKPDLLETISVVDVVETNVLGVSDHTCFWFHGDEGFITEWMVENSDLFRERLVLIRGIWAL